MFALEFVTMIVERDVSLQLLLLEMFLESEKFYWEYIKSRWTSRQKSVKST